MRKTSSVLPRIALRVADRIATCLHFHSQRAKSRTMSEPNLQALQQAVRERQLAVLCLVFRSGSCALVGSISQNPVSLHSIKFSVPALSLFERLAFL